MEKEVDKQQHIQYLMFENDNNLCWLDASLVLVAHNKTFKKIVESSPDSEIKKIISTYIEAVAVYNNSISEYDKITAQKLLSSIQTSTLAYLKQFLKFKPGEPDSAFCALLNLIYQDKSNIKEHLNVSWIWRKQCSNCGTNSKSATCLKPIITLSKADIFHPECPSSIYMCTCKSEQEMKLIYKELPSCLIFHFEKGVGIKTKFPLTFFIKGREYQMTSMIILEKSSDSTLNHFVTWIRNPFTKLWLNCNDLNEKTAFFSPVKPEFGLKDMYISVYEAFDNLDKISNNEASSDQEQDAENVELIDLSDEDAATKDVDSFCKTKPSEFSKEIKNDETLNFLQNSYSEIDTSKKEFLGNVKEDKYITNQNLKMCNNERPNKNQNSCNISNRNLFASHSKFPIKIGPDYHEIEAKFKNFDQKKASVKFSERKELKTEAAYNPLYKVAEASVENISSPSVGNKTFTIQNLEIHNKTPKEDGKACNNNCRNVSINSLLFPNKNSSNKQKTEEKSKNVDCQDEVIDEAFKTKKFRAEAIDNSTYNVTDASNGNKKKYVLSSSVNNKTSAMQNLGMCSSSKQYKESDKTCNINNQNISTSNFMFPNNPEMDVKSKIFNYQDKVLKESVKTKEFRPEITSKVTDASVKNKKENSSSLFDADSDNKKTAIGTTNEKPSSGIKSTHNNSISSKLFEDNSGINEMNIENKYASSSKRKKEATDNKCCSLNKEKKVGIINNPIASTSLADDEISSANLRRSKRNPKPKNSNCHTKRAKMSDNIIGNVFKKTNDEIAKQNDNADEKHNSRNQCNARNAQDYKKNLPAIVERTLSAFFQTVITSRESKLKT